MCVSQGARSIYDVKTIILVYLGGQVESKREGRKAEESLLSAAVAPSVLRRAGPAMAQRFSTDRHLLSVSVPEMSEKTGSIIGFVGDEARSSRVLSLETRVWLMGSVACSLRCT